MEKTYSGSGISRTRNTQQRKAVLRAVQSLAGSHPTAADIHNTLREEHPQMSLATVYRALHALVRQNSVCEMRIENTARYDAGPCPHHHLVCRHCGSVTDICAESLPPTVLQTLKLRIADTGFTLDNYPVQFSGLCAKCASSA
ncbi:MAG: transcriptional repressor [Capsulimonadales bacterium]|nr:transcriptional repressor [Capsulimonadales bacterium]